MRLEKRLGTLRRERRHRIDQALDDIGMRRRRRNRRVVGHRGGIADPEAVGLLPDRFDDAGWVANRWCEILPLPIDAKHRLLSLDPISRLDIVDSLMRVRHTPH